MIAEILSTGDELRTGSLVDTNSAYIAEKLERAGIRVARHTTVGDDIGEIAAAIGEIAGRADLAVATGGLGPTEDDLTAEAAARAAGVELVFDEKALESVEAYFAMKKFPMPPSNRKQAKLPEGSRCLKNPVGTAPGFELKIKKCVFCFIPGVPHEMRKMLKERIMPRVFELSGENRRFGAVKTITTFGLPEATTGELLSGFPDEFPDIKLGLRARFPEIFVKLYADAGDEKKLSEILDGAGFWVSQKLGGHVVSLQGRSMEETVGGLLVEKNATVAVAESCTGGLISHMLTNTAGSSGYFLFTGVTYSNESKIDILGVSPETIRKYGAVHRETAKEMAEGARRVSGATYAISTSGIAGPDGGTDEKPVGTVCVGLAWPNGSEGRTLHLPFPTRAMNKRIFAAATLDILRKKLLES